MELNNNNEPQKGVWYEMPQNTGAYCISMTPGRILNFGALEVAQTNNPELTRFAAYSAADAANQLQTIRQDPGLRMNLLLNPRNFKLDLYGGSKKAGQILTDYPDLAVNGRLLWWKLYGVTLPANNAVKLHFYNIQTNECVTAWAVLGCGELMCFMMDAPGENGKTSYAYIFDAESCCAKVHEISKCHERYVFIDEHGHCRVHEIV